MGSAKDKRSNDSGPLIGLFWLVKGKLLIDSIPLFQTEPYGDHLTYPLGHDAVWERYQRNGTVPEDVAYEEPPRGRVVYNTKTLRFALLADRCILKRADLVRRVKKEMRLPASIDIDSDSHYCCFNCLYSDHP